MYNPAIPEPDYVEPPSEMSDEEWLELFGDPAWAKANLQCDGWDGPCSRQDAIKFHMNTAYINEESNYRNLCPGGGS